MSRDRHPADAPGTRLIDAKDRQLGFRWPNALDKRLDELVDRAVDAGENTTRRELLAAILLGADLDGEALGRLLKRYRTATVADALLEATTEEGDVIRFPVHRPGPRPRTR